MSSFIIEKVVLLPCIPVYRTNSNTCYGDLFQNFKKMNNKDVPEEVIQKFKETNDYYVVFQNKIYRHYNYDEEIYHVQDIGNKDKEIEEEYNNRLPLIKQIEGLIGKRITLKDLPLNVNQTFDLLSVDIKPDLYNKGIVVPIIKCYIAKMTGRMHGGVIYTKLTDMCEIHVTEIINVCKTCHQIIHKKEEESSSEELSEDF